MQCRPCSGLDETGKPKLKVNSGVPDAFFKPESVIPAGYRVLDEQKNETYTMPPRQSKVPSTADTRAEPASQAPD